PLPQAVADGDRTVSPADPDVHVQAERVVAPDDVAQELVVAAVVRRVDHPLVLPWAPRMRAGAAERDPERIRQLAQLRTALAHLRGGPRERPAGAPTHPGL